MGMDAIREAGTLYARTSGLEGAFSIRIGKYWEYLKEEERCQNKQRRIRATETVARRQRV
jgi:hypothetical protein